MPKDSVEGGQITDENALSFKLVNQQDDRKFSHMSKVGCKLIKDNLKQILDSLSIFTNNIYSTKKLKNLTKSQMKRINILMSEFSMFIAYFCESNNEKTQKFISIVTKFWDVQKFNKTTDIPQRRIRTAEELVNFEKEVEF